jgi:hypothetical protein
MYNKNPIALKNKLIVFRDRDRHQRSNGGYY